MSWSRRRAEADASSSAAEYSRRMDWFSGGWVDESSEGREGRRKVGGRWEGERAAVGKR